MTNSKESIDEMIALSIKRDDILEPLRDLIRDAYGRRNQYGNPIPGGQHATDVYPCPVCAAENRGKHALRWIHHTNGHIHFFCESDQCVRIME